MVVIYNVFEDKESECYRKETIKNQSQFDTALLFDNRISFFLNAFTYKSSDFFIKANCRLPIETK